jgi:hypothetical protein
MILAEHVLVALHRFFPEVFDRLATFFADDEIPLRVVLGWLLAHARSCTACIYIFSLGLVVLVVSTFFGLDVVERLTHGDLPDITGCCLH